VFEKYERPWGYYKNIYGHDNTGYKVKKIVVYPGHRLSLQTHEHRSEHWVIINGVGKVQVGQDFFNVSPGIHIFIPLKTLHRISNVGSENIIMIETQIGEYLGEDDIKRYDDDYGRK
jgi:mannose-6-phosphate isomerase-like protein (cupin superfamily)